MIECYSKPPQKFFVKVIDIKIERGITSSVGQANARTIKEIQMAKKVTQKFIRNFLRTIPDAVDLDELYSNNAGTERGINEVRETLYVSRGLYGINGFIQRGMETGKFYICASRSSAMFYYL